MGVPKLEDIDLMKRLGPQGGTFEGLEKVAKSIGQYPSRNVIDLAKHIQTAGGKGVTLDSQVAGASLAFLSILGIETAIGLDIEEGKSQDVYSAVNWAFLFGLGLGCGVTAGRD